MSNRQLFFVLLLFSIAVTAIKSDAGCEVVKSEDPCPETEYSAYLNCIQKRSKRSVTNCNSEANEFSCNECDCNFCASNECTDSCNTCCTPTCETAYCCHKTCHSQCKHSSCRKECKKTCSEQIKKPESDTLEAVQLPNITTIINLKNNINNTNIIDVPVFINTTNINNVTLENDILKKSYPGVGQVDGESGQEVVDEGVLPMEPGKEQPTDDVGSGKEQNCCQIISPRQCVPKNEYPFMQCFHYRQKVCGDVCRSPIMHVQPHLICDEQPSGPPNCHNQMIYEPQPQPRCTYQEHWPYVSCQIQPANCDDCYGHFTGYQQTTGCPISCTSGHNIGLYNQGSYAQPYPSYGSSPYGYNPYNTYPQYPNMGALASPYENLYSIAKDPQQFNPEVSDPTTLFTKFMNPAYDAGSAPAYGAGSSELNKIPSVNGDTNMFINLLNNETVAEEVPLADLEVDARPVEAPALVKVKVVKQPSLLIQQAEDTKPNKV